MTISVVVLVLGVIRVVYQYMDSTSSRERVFEFF